VNLSALAQRWFTPLAAVLILALAVGVFKTKTDAAAARRRIAELEEKVAAQRDEAKGLGAEVQYLESPGRLEKLARKELKMAPATRKQQQPVEQAP
jgi:cell division protein FtsL